MGFEDGRQGGWVGGVSGGGEAVHVFEGAEDVVLGDGSGIVGGLDHGAVEEDGDLIAGLVAFVPGDDEQTVVLHGPRGVGGDVGLVPLVGSVDRPAVHVVLLVGDDVRDRRQGGEALGEVFEWHGIPGGEVGEREPRIVGGGVVADAAAAIRS